MRTAGVALTAAPAVVPALGANNKLNVAWIGVGTRGNYLMQRYFAVPENKEERGRGRGLRRLQRLPGTLRRPQSNPTAAKRPSSTPTTRNS